MWGMHAYFMLNRKLQVERTFRLVLWGGVLAVVLRRAARLWAPVMTIYLRNGHPHCCRPRRSASLGLGSTHGLFHVQPSTPGMSFECAHELYRIVLEHEGGRTRSRVISSSL